jgi:hypothetical protein
MICPCLRCDRPLTYAEWERPGAPMCPPCVGAMFDASADALRDEAAQLRRMAALAALAERDDLVLRFDALADLDERYAGERPS